jgi:hypothetical protein
VQSSRYFSLLAFSSACHDVDAHKVIDKAIFSLLVKIVYLLPQFSAFKYLAAEQQFEKKLTHNVQIWLCMEQHLYQILLM